MVIAQNDEIKKKENRYKLVVDDVYLKIKF